MKLLTFFMNSPVSESTLLALGEVVRDKKPEFIALQNVTNEMLKKVMCSVWAAGYNTSQPPYKYENRKKPTIALLSTYPYEEDTTISYAASLTSKVLQKSYYVMYDKQKQPFVVCVASTVLETDLKAIQYRDKQLNEALANMKDVEDCFLLGGFALDNDIDGELTLHGGWRDAWLEVAGNTESNGYTYDPEKNPLIKEDPFGPGRPDRVFFNSRHYKLESVTLVGDTPAKISISDGAPPDSVTISTHYGILSHFSPLDTPNRRAEPRFPAAVFKRTEWSVQFQENQQ